MGCIFSFLSNKKINKTYNSNSLSDTLNDKLLLTDSNDDNNNDMFYDDDNNRISYIDLINNYKNYKNIEQKLNILEINTQENIKALSKDIHDIYNEFQNYASNHQLSSR
jgi:hypothetical protein